MNFCGAALKQCVLWKAFEMYTDIHQVLSTLEYVCILIFLYDSVSVLDHHLTSKPESQSVDRWVFINVYHFDIVLSLSVLYLNRSSVKGVRVEATAHPSHRAAAALACKSSHHSRQQKTTLWIHRSLRIKHTLRWWTHEQRTPLPCQKRLGIITTFWFFSGTVRTLVNRTSFLLSLHCICTVSLEQHNYLQSCQTHSTISFADFKFCTGRITF